MTYKVGDVVYWRSGWGTGSPRLARIERNEKTEGPDEKYGEEVQEITDDEYFVVTLDNNHWSYSEHIEPFPSDERKAKG